MVTGTSTKEHRQGWTEIFGNDHSMFVVDKGVRVTQVTVSKPHKSVSKTSLVAAFV